MNRLSRRAGQTVLVNRLAIRSECAEWMRSRRKLAPNRVDPQGREWEQYWPPSVGDPDLPAWRLVDDPDAA